MLENSFKTVFTIAVLCIASAGASAQFVKVVSIEVEGTKRTKDKIVLRELEFKVGDRLQQSQLARIVVENELNLLATGLFTKAEMNISEWDFERDEVEIVITLAESPWIIPVPIFELADRNFNVWWNEFNASLKRVNYGGKVYLQNAWGYGERVKLEAQFGYTPKFEVEALLPFIDQNQNVRLEVKAAYSRNKETRFYNDGDKPVFESAEDERVIFTQQEYWIGMIFRPKIFATHRFRVGYWNNSIDEELMLTFNPDFFLDEKTRQQFIFARYEMRYDKRDLPVLPSEGFLLGVNFFKEGFGVFGDLSATYFEPIFEYYYSPHRKWITSVALRGSVALERQQQPYNNYRGIGYGQAYVRGYELYVSDGLDWVIGKVGVQFKLFDTRINWKKLMPIESMRDMSVRIYLATFYDTGYANDPFYSEGNQFVNRWLHGGGFGLNLLLYDTFQFQVECSFNHLGEKGIFLHSNTSF